MFYNLFHDISRLLQIVSGKGLGMGWGPSNWTNKTKAKNYEFFMILVDCTLINLYWDPLESYIDICAEYPRGDISNEGEENIAFCKRRFVVLNWINWICQIWAKGGWGEKVFVCFEQVWGGSNVCKGCKLPKTLKRFMHSLLWEFKFFWDPFSHALKAFCAFFHL